MTADHDGTGAHTEPGEPGEAGKRGKEQGEYRGHGEYAKHGEHGEGGEYGGMDALMAAITGEPLPDEARRDPGFRAEHRAAEADLAVLRDQLALLAEVLTGEEPPAGKAPGDAGPGEPAAGRTGTAGRTEAAGTAGTSSSQAGGAGSSRAADAGGGREAVGAGRRSRSRTRPGGPGRPGGRGRAVRAAFGALAGAAALSLVLGFGWLVTRGGLDDNGEASSKSAAGAVPEDTGSAVPPADPERELACSRLVVEGTVARVERRGDSSRRITLTVTHAYRPASGPAEVGFLVGPDARPAPRVGQHVLVRIARGERYPSRWAVGDGRVAAERAWITEALPGSRNTACPSGDAS